MQKIVRILFQSFSFCHFRHSVTMSASIPSTMRASQWSSSAGGLEKNLRVNEEAAMPAAAHSLGADQTLVKVYYSALNPVDYKLPEAPFISTFSFKKPATPSMDFSGRVVSTSRSDLKPGQYVFGKTEPSDFGALAEYLVVGREGCVPVPDGVAMQDVGCIGVAGLTALQCISPYVQQGDKVFINGGTGGTGSFGVQEAKALGCYVVASCSGSNVELCKRLGADEVIDYRTQDIVQTLKRKGMQFDHVVDFVGSPPLYWAAHHYLKPGKCLVNVGATPSLSTLLDFMKIYLWPAALGGGQRKYVFLRCKATATQYAQIGQWIKEGKVKPVIGHVFTLDEAPKAFQTLKAGGFQGKIVIKVAEEGS